MILLYYEQNFYKIMSQFLEGGLFFYFCLNFLCNNYPREIW